jgi:hypothetical protein
MQYDSTVLRAWFFHLPDPGPPIFLKSFGNCYFPALAATTATRREAGAKLSVSLFRFFKIDLSSFSSGWTQDWPFLMGTSKN